MALQWQAVLLLLLHLHHLQQFVTGSPITEITEENRIDLLESYRQRVVNLVDTKYNEKPNRLALYSLGSLLSFQKQDDDKIKVNFTIRAVCLPESEQPCRDDDVRLQYCCAIFDGNDGNPYDFSCSHRKDDDNEESVNPSDWFSSEKYWTLKEITETPLQEERVDYWSGMHELDTQVPGIETLIDTALQHLESERADKHLAVKVLKLHREIVSSVTINFYLLLEVVDGTGSEICLIEYHQNPKKSYDKHIVANNCTVTQEFAAVSKGKGPNDFDNEIDVNNEYKKPMEPPETIADSPNFDKMAETGNLEEAEVTPARLLDIVAQIIPTDSTQRLQEVVESIVEATKFGVDSDGAQMAIEDVPSMPTSTAGLDRETLQSELNSDETDEKEDSDEGKRRKRQVESKSSEESDEVKKLGGVQLRSKRDADSSASSSEETKTEKTVEKPHEDGNKEGNDLGVRRRKRSNDDDSSSSSSSSDDDDDDDDGKDAKRKHKKYRKKVNCKNDDDDDDDDDDCPKKKPIKKISCNDNDDDKTNDCQKSVKKSKCDEDDDDDDDDDDDCSKNNKKSAKNKKKDSSSSSSSSSSDDEDDKRNKRDLHGHDEGGSTEEQTVAALANFAARQLDNGTYKHEVLEVLRVQKVELESAIYRMVIRFATTKCNEIGACYPTGDDKLCKMQLHLFKDHSMRMIKSRCHNIERDADKNRTKRGIPGAPIDASTDESIKELAKATLLQLDASSAHANKLKIGKIHNATKQVVAGLLYKIHCDIVESDCVKTDVKDSDLCGERKDGVRKTCEITIWDQPWLPNGKKTNVTCGDEFFTYRTKRSLSQVDVDLNQQFDDFVEKYDKVYYTDAEKDFRFEIFKRNMAKVELLRKHEQGSAIYGASRFADLHEAEFRQYLGLRPDLHVENDISLPHAKVPEIDLPTEYDWRVKGAVTEVKDQGQCGSCWAFSVTGNIEGQNAIKYGKLLELSEQELVDCDKIDEGCNGGYMTNAYRAIEKLGGLELESDYPYDAEDETCKYKPGKSRVKLSGAVNISQNEDDMAKWLVKNGPISIGINANAMQLYMGGVSHPPKFLCSPKELDHGVLIVGYGVHTYKLFNRTLPYWTVKNSWGPRWGEQGYYRVYRGDGTCGVNKMASSGIVN